jgi:hypothetical protein
MSDEEIHQDRIKNPDHVKAIKSYTHGSYVTNKALHVNYDGGGLSKKSQEAAKPDRHLKKKISDMDGVFSDKSNHVGKDHVVYTGLPESPQGVFDREKKKSGTAPKHVEVHLPAYTSTSTKRHVAEKFAEQVGRSGAQHVLKIHVPAGHPAISLKAHSKYQGNNDESEVLLHRDTRLHIHHEPEYDNYTNTYVWHAHVAGHHPTEIK